jgi:hypothetical protein
MVLKPLKLVTKFSGLALTKSKIVVGRKPCHFNLIKKESSMKRNL